MFQLFPIEKEYDKQSLLNKYINIFGLKIRYSKNWGIEGFNNKIKFNKKKLKGIVVKIIGSNNEIIINDQSNINNLLIVIIGNDNKIEIGSISSYLDSRILIQGSYNNVVIDNSDKFIKNTNINVACDNGNLHINKNISIIGSEINLRTNHSQIDIGEDCMLSNNVTIMSGDGHLIIDKTTHQPIHTNGFCKVGNHVWIGKDSTICKNTVIPDGCVIGTNSVVTKKFKEQNSVIAGIPAKVIRKNIEWDREYKF